MAIQVTSRRSGSYSRGAVVSRARSGWSVRAGSGRPRFAGTMVAADGESSRPVECGSFTTCNWSVMSAGWQRVTAISVNRLQERGDVAATLFPAVTVSHRSGSQAEIHTPSTHREPTSRLIQTPRDTPTPRNPRRLEHTRSAQTPEAAHSALGRAESEAGAPCPGVTFLLRFERGPVPEPCWTCRENPRTLYKSYDEISNRHVSQYRHQPA